jgi:hypothetical protein
MKEKNEGNRLGHLSLWKFLFCCLNELFFVLSVCLSSFSFSIFLSAYSSFCHSVYLCLSVFLFFCFSVFLSSYLSVFFTLLLSVLLSLCHSVFLYFCLSVFLPVYLSYCLTVLLSYCLTVLLSYCLTVFLSFCLSVFSCLRLCVHLSQCLSVYWCICLFFTYLKGKDFQSSRLRRPQRVLRAGGWPRPCVGRSPRVDTEALRNCTPRCDTWSFAERKSQKVKKSFVKSAN